jgi:glycine oxidase
MAAPKRSAYDVVVVGAGVIGLSCGWRAAQRGLSVLVVERERPGAGSSGVAAGMLAPVTEADFGEQALLRLNLESVRAWPAFADELGEHNGYEPHGALVVAADRDDAEELRRLHAFQRSLGLEAEWLGPRACRRLEPGLSPRVAGGIHAAGDHQVDPRALLAALSRALDAAGGELVCGAEVEAVELDGDRATGVRIRGGVTIAAGDVVVAAGSWSSSIAPAPPVRPVKGQILRFAAAAPLASRLIRTPRCYVVTRASGEVVIGATQEERGFDTRVTADGVFRLLEAALEVLPDVAELELLEAGARLRPASPDNAPMIGSFGVEGLVWATGHHRNGILLAPVTADQVCELICSGAVPAFSPERFERRIAA